MSIVEEIYRESQSQSHCMQPQSQCLQPPSQCIQPQSQCIQPQVAQPVVTTHSYFAHPDNATVTVPTYSCSSSYVQPQAACQPPVQPCQVTCNVQPPCSSWTSAYPSYAYQTAEPTKKSKKKSKTSSLAVYQPSTTQPAVPPSKRTMAMSAAIGAMAGSLTGALTGAGVNLLLARRAQVNGEKEALKEQAAAEKAAKKAAKKAGKTMPYGDTYYSTAPVYTTSYSYPRKMPKNVIQQQQPYTEYTEYVYPLPTTTSTATAPLRSYDYYAYMYPQYGSNYGYYPKQQHKRGGVMASLKPRMLNAFNNSALDVQLLW